MSFDFSDMMFQLSSVNGRTKFWDIKKLTLCCLRSSLIFYVNFPLCNKTTQSICMDLSITNFIKACDIPDTKNNNVNLLAKLSSIYKI